VPDSTDGLGVGSDLADLRKEREADLEQKIRDEFRFIDGLTVSVNCDVENRETKENVVAYDKKTSLSLPKTNTEQTLETSSSSPGSHEPGASSNTGANGSVSLPDATGGAGSSPPNTSNTSKTDTTFDNLAGRTERDVVTPAGKDSVLSATVRVPLSYFTASYKLTFPKAGDPTDDAITAYRTSELAKIRDGVKNVIGLKSEADLSVDYYADMPTELAMAAGPLTPAATLNTVSGHAREIGVAVLAVVSLLMMATMVRKSTPPALVLPTLGGGEQTGQSVASSRINPLGSGESVAGEVGTGDGALDGMEMDEDAVRTQQMLDQVSTMVKENPDGAAALVKRWLSRV
jgi:flagellar biosynthesis/type III secretory pathway M-ring protein FliF/YscJ